MPLVLIGLSHHTAPVTVREKFAFKEAELAAVMRDIRQLGLATESVILSTCNRVEIYAVVESGEKQRANELLAYLKQSRQALEAPDSEFYIKSEPLSVEHLFKVACGLDSMVLGETEILGQLKKAYDIALQEKLTGARLNKAFQRAFNVAKHIRTSTNIQRGSVSVGSVAVELAEKIFTRLEDRNVMVLGAGDTSEKTARSLLSRGAKSIIVSNRSYDRAVALAEELGGKAISFDDWSAAFETIDIVISSTSAPHYILDRARLEPLMKARKHKPLLLIDIAVPRDIDPEVNYMESVYLYNIDNLQAIADASLKQRREEISKCEIYIRDKALGLIEHLAPGKNAGPATLAFES